MRNKIEDIFAELDRLSSAEVPNKELYSYIAKPFGVTEGSAKVYVAKWRKARGTGRTNGPRKVKVDVQA